MQVWKDVDGVLTCDPNIYERAEPVPYLTFDEAAELAYFGAQVFLSVCPHTHFACMFVLKQMDICRYSILSL